MKEIETKKIPINLMLTEGKNNMNMPAEIDANLYDRYVDQYTVIWNKFLIERIDEEKNKLNMSSGLVLDIGAGTARTIIEMASLSNFKNFKFIGVDFFPDMVTKAKDNIVRFQLDHIIRIEQGDVHCMSYRDETFDIIIGRSVVHHWQDPVMAYQEMYRVLKPGGFILIHEPCKNPDPQALSIFNKYRQDCGIHGVNLESKYTTEEIHGQLARAGLD